MKSIRQKFALIATVLALTACGSEEQEATIASTAFNQVKAKFGGSAGASGAAAQPDMSWIETNEKPLTIVLVENSQAMGFLALEVTNGRYKTWRSSDGATFTIRNGFLTATKALGEDLVSAQVPVSVITSGTQKRVHYYLDGDEQVAPTSLSCNWKYVGAEVSPILTKTYQTKHYQESCSSDDLSFRNDYWIDSSGSVRQSRQFVSSGVGYLSLMAIKD
jgi:hypothetical protein